VRYLRPWPSVRLQRSVPEGRQPHVLGDARNVGRANLLLMPLGCRAPLQLHTTWLAPRLKCCAGGDDNGLLGALKPINLTFGLGALRELQSEMGLSRLASRDGFKSGFSKIL
jgi:hypothetical protein